MKEPPPFSSRLREMEKLSRSVNIPPKMRRPFTFSPITTKWLIAAFFAFALGIIYKTFRDYGVTWDEAYHQTYGDLILRWYLSFFSDTAAVRHVFLIFYGGFFDTLVQLATYLFPWGPLETRHLLGALFGLWAAFMSFKIAQHIAGSLAGFFSALFLLLHPVFFGHMFNNPVDSPFAALLLTTLYSMISTYDNLPSLSLKDLFKIGLPLGLTLAIRISGIFILLPCLIFFWCLWFVSQRSQTKESPAYPIRQTLGVLARNLAGILAIAWPVMLVWWPWAQLNPLMNPFASILKAIHWDLNSSAMTVLFDGKNYGFFQAPKSYLPRSIFVTLPEFFFIVLFIGILGAALLMFRKPKFTGKRIQTTLLVFAFVFPVAGAMLSNAPRFDGFRHYLFLFPLLAVGGGISFATFLSSKIIRGIKILVGAAVAFSLCLTAFDMCRLHPYETVYFNRIPAGGLTQAAKKYETDYWGNSYREGIFWVIKNYHPDLKRKIRVMNASEPFQIAYYLERTPELRDRFETVKNDPDIYLSTTRWERHKIFPGKVLYTVERDHTPLLYVIEVTGKPS